MRTINADDVLSIIDDLRDRMTVVGYWSVVERVKALPSAQPEPCEDAVSRKAVLDIVDHNRGRLQIGREVTKLPSVRPQRKKGRWIPCSERLPEAEVLCCDKRGEMIIGYPYQDDESNTGYSAVLDDVYMIDCIAWMEKPEPYKGGGVV